FANGFVIVTRNGNAYKRCKDCSTFRYVLPELEPEILKSSMVRAIVGGNSGKGLLQSCVFGDNVREAQPARRTVRATVLRFQDGTLGDALPPVDRIADRVEMPMEGDSFVCNGSRCSSPSRRPRLCRRDDRQGETSDKRHPRRAFQTHWWMLDLARQPSPSFNK